MEKTADLAVVQKTNIDTLHKEGKSQKVITERQGRPKPLWGPKQNFIWGPLGAANMTGYCQSLIIHTL